MILLALITLRVIQLFAFYTPRARGWVLDRQWLISHSLVLADGLLNVGEEFLYESNYLLALSWIERNLLSVMHRS